MHDPMTVAFEVPLPILRRSTMPDRGGRRWGVTVSRRTNPENLGERTYSWWRPRGYAVVLAGHQYRWRTAAVIWHVEPDGRDSGEVCRHYRRQSDGTTKVLRSWRWHVHHWRIQLPVVQELRRTLLTRCAWCMGPSWKGARVNVSHDWDRDPTPWWRGEPGLYHSDCSSAARSARSCTCDSPVLNRDTWGTCARCGLGYGHGRTPEQTAALRRLKQVPRGQRPASVSP